MRYMLDTNICIYAIKKKPEIVLKRIKDHRNSDICISSITYAELCHGVEKSTMREKNRIALALLLTQIEVLDFDSRASEKYGLVRADLEMQGRIIGPLDMMIAGHALALGCTLVTNNTKEFERVQNIRLENWAE